MKELTEVTQLIEALYSLIDEVKQSKEDGKINFTEKIKIASKAITVINETKDIEIDNLLEASNAFIASLSIKISKHSKKLDEIQIYHILSILKHAGNLIKSF